MHNNPYRANRMARHALFAGLLTLASAGTQAAQISRVAFIGMPAPHTVAQLTSIVTPLSYHSLFSNLDKVGSSRYAAGQLYNAKAEPLLDPLGKPVIAETPDANSLLAIPKAGRTADGRDKLFLVTHFEYDWLLSDGSSASKAKGWYKRLPMSMTLTTIAQDADGGLAAIAQKPIDFSRVQGLWIPCAASQTPWNTHLAGEEDYDLFKRDKADKAIAGMGELYLGGRPANPYRYGHVTEVRVTAEGDTVVDKHYAMGRAAWEKAEVMPDQRTVYMGDDGAYTGLFMFIADRPGDLGAGTLYAAHWEQQDDRHGGRAKLQWIKLGHASDVELAAMLDKEVFSGGNSSIFDFADVTHGKVPKGYVAIRAGLKKTTEYVKLKPGKAKAAAFLDSRRYAAYKGATTEFNKMEGVAVDADRQRLYVAMSYIGRGMTGNDGGPRDDIRVARSKAGGVYQLQLQGKQKDSDGHAIDSNWVAVNMAGVAELMGVDLAQADALGNTADPALIANPDNIVFSEKLRTLFVGEDSGTHSNNFLWAYNVDSKQLSRILSIPMGAESTGLQVVENINGHAYLMSNYQHAGEHVGKRHIKDAALKQAVIERLNRFEAKVGYIDGLPAM
jgi:secreted PhoX family phosphatase